MKEGYKINKISSSFLMGFFCLGNFPVKRYKDIYSYPTVPCKKKAKKQKKIKQKA
jgi:hypothetical protein